MTASPAAAAARQGLLATPKTLPPWLFYDAAGSALFERITELPEYYLTRTERAILAENADAILGHLPGPITIAELGAGTATKTGLLLRAAAARQPSGVLYQPIDVSHTALGEARITLEAAIPNLQVRLQVANYVTQPIRIERPAGTHILALYIGSSIGNFAPAEARQILLNLRRQLQPGDALLLGTDLAPSPTKTAAQLLAAYDDAAGVTAAFNRNILTHLNRELGIDFDVAAFQHQARWNAAASQIEMHLAAVTPQTVCLPADDVQGECIIHFATGETIHTENSRKFTLPAVASLLHNAGLQALQTYQDANSLYAVTLAEAV